MRSKLTSGAIALAMAMFMIVAVGCSDDDDNPAAPTWEAARCYASSTVRRTLQLSTSTRKACRPAHPGSGVRRNVGVSRARSRHLQHSDSRGRRSVELGTVFETGDLPIPDDVRSPRLRGLLAVLRDHRKRSA